MFFVSLIVPDPLVIVLATAVHREADSQIAQGAALL